MISGTGLSLRVELLEINFNETNRFTKGWFPEGQEETPVIVNLSGI